MNNLFNLALKYSKKRAGICNDHNGKALISCIVIGKKNQYVLWKWNKLL